MRLSTAEIKQMKSQGGRGKTFTISFIGSLILAFVTAHMVGYTAQLFSDISSVSNGLQTGFWLWLGYIATLTLTQVLFERKSWKLSRQEECYVTFTSPDTLRYRGRLFSNRDVARRKLSYP